MTDIKKVDSQTTDLREELSDVELERVNDGRDVLISTPNVIAAALALDLEALGSGINPTADVNLNTK